MSLLVALPIVLASDQRVSASAGVSPDTVCSQVSACAEHDNVGAGVGVFGTASNADGITGQAGKKNSLGPDFGVYGLDGSASGTLNYGVWGYTNYGIAVQGIGTCLGICWNDVVAQTNATEGGGTGTEADLNNSPNGTAFQANDKTIIAGGDGNLAPTAVFQSDDRTPAVLNIGGTALSNQAEFDENGNLVLYSGLIYTGGSCSTGCIKTHLTDGSDATTYGVRAASPTIDDEGRGTLVEGHGRVIIDRAFSKLMSPGGDYYAFVTPEGDCKGLFVTNRSSKGFDVQENLRGRSTIEFSYRIVARPFDNPRGRLGVWPGGASKTRGGAF